MREQLPLLSLHVLYLGRAKFPSAFLIPFHSKLRRRDTWRAWLPRLLIHGLPISHVCNAFGVNPAPAIVHRGLAYCVRYLSSWPWWTVFEVCIEEVWHAVCVIQPLNIYSHTRKQLHHAMNDEPTAEACIMSVNSLEPSVCLVFKKRTRKVSHCCLGLASSLEVSGFRNLRWMSG